MKKYYAGIGSRITPDCVLDEMIVIAQLLSDRGYILRSGGADGADTAFETGSAGRNEIFIPWIGFNGRRKPALSAPTVAAFELAATVHPFWTTLTQPTRMLFARNAHQILGPNLDSPVNFVLCWTPDGCETEAKYKTGVTGGTGIGIILADRNEIPVINMRNYGWIERFERLLKSGNLSDV